MNRYWYGPDVIRLTVAFFLISALLGSFGLSVSSGTEIGGSATLTVLNSAPAIDGVSVFNGHVPVNEILANREYSYFVNVTEKNSLDDIREVMLKIDLVTEGKGGGSTKEKFIFKYLENSTLDAEFNGKFVQIKPKEGNYLDVNSPSHIVGITSDGAGSFVFKVTLDTEYKNNVAKIKTSVMDTSGKKIEGPSIKMKFVKMTETESAAPSKQINQSEPDVIMTNERSGNKFVLYLFGASMISIVSLFFGRVHGKGRTRINRLVDRRK